MCRNDSYLTLPGIERNPETGEAILQVVPNKTRCGSEDPVEMSPDNKCYCWPKENRGSCKYECPIVYPQTCSPKKLCDKIIPWEINILTWDFSAFIFLVTGSWMTMEIRNIPFLEDYLDLESQAFKDAKYIIEKAVRIHFCICYAFVSLLFQDGNQ